MVQKGKILDMEKYRIIQVLKGKGFQWLEDKNGRVKMWVKTKSPSLLNETEHVPGKRQT